MSHSTNSNVRFCDVCSLSFETKKGLYRHQLYDTKHKELLEKMFDSDLDEAITEAPTKTEASTKTIEKMYDSVGDFIHVKRSTKTETKDIIDTKTKGSSTLVHQPDENIYTRIKFECKECHEEFRSKVALTTHSYSHNRIYLFKSDLIRKINTTPIKLLIKLGLDVTKESLESLIWEPAPMIKSIKELTINDDRKLVLAAITLYNVLL